MGAWDDDRVWEGAQRGEGGECVFGGRCGDAPVGEGEAAVADATGGMARGRWGAGLRRTGGRECGGQRQG